MPWKEGPDPAPEKGPDDAAPEKEPEAAPEKEPEAPPVYTAEPEVNRYLRLHYLRLYCVLHDTC